ncbi:MULTISPECIES: DNA methyltransferase [unclassified Brevundimonas]|uniref:class I SAM-dependent DNA methyltransferase n=1 Tax=unclassified Brevundimonas TaxID=2622653 RepID=UPI000CFBA233|nr:MULTISPECIES: DNA methyltransferase [unclassified Brevundimonas]PRA28991.1 lactate dehydrogenase [Brevundimonas sp. MYb27]PQZ84685.1 lactate dehydrogenase [Brevundimonas sp. MYb31]PRB12458.1 lactate dehydrogenase [Brevundimonas sp. MYb52]PRB32921.1 lactate dehydrogenase [Brevundimonas sp. MYb46]PRB50305.1 lactate dehydrogenase [Brevundimonas sp. MYb33]
MNAVEIEEAVSALAEAPFDAEAFPFAFLAAFGNKETAIKRLRTGATNQSDLPGGVLQRSNIHVLVAPQEQVAEALGMLRDSPRTKSAKARYVLATDGVTLEAEDLTSGETVVCDYVDLPNHFGFFLPLAGITTVRQIRESAFDIRATSRLNRLYVELLKDNPEWGTPERRSAMNHFMARLIFCFFAEDTGIFPGQRRFTLTIDQMSARDSSNTHEVIETLFRAMNTKTGERAAAGGARWADAFPYVNGGLFSGGTEVPRFSKIARSYLLHIGNLDWTQINPDIFGSMIQAVADDEERGALGMHYTSVPNILKVLNPLFLDDLRAQVEAAGDNPRMLLNLRKRMSRIRVFDPACGSGNFLVIAYKQMREIEAEINKRRGEPDRRSEIPLTNFRGIELREFPAEIARLALIIAEYQADEFHRGQKEAVRDFLPLDKDNWITCGNALRLDWLSVCPPTGTGVRMNADDLFASPLDQAEIDFENEGGETYLCGNPPYLGSKWQSAEQKSDLGALFDGRTKNWKSLDYVAGWFIKATDYGLHTHCAAAFVSTNSICQGQQVPILWPLIFRTGHEIAFAHTSFKWTNLASHNAGVTVAIVGISNHAGKGRLLFSIGEDGTTILREAENINAYLVAAQNIEVEAIGRPISNLATMQFGNHPYYGGPLIFSKFDADLMRRADPRAARFIRPLYGAQEFISAAPRACLWISDDEAAEAGAVATIAERMDAVVIARRAAKQDKAAQKLAETPYRFRDQETAEDHVLVVPRVSSENRPYLPVGLLSADAIIQDQAFALYDAPLWNLALIASRLHLVWIANVCGKLETRYRYSNTLGWNTFPVPTLTETNKAELTACAEEILLAREAHFPATIADLYAPENMPADLRAAHERNDETLERIYIGRRFRNDTERLEKLFELYIKMTTTVAKAAGSQTMN